MTGVDLRAPELITLVFSGQRADPGVAEVLAGLAAGGDIRVLDLVFVTRTADDLVQITRAREPLDETGLGPLRVSTPELISEDDLGAVRDWLKPGTSAAVVAYEHRWLRRLEQAVTDAGGTVMLSHDAARRAESRQAVADSEAAVRAAEADAQAAERAAERYSTTGSSYQAADDDLVSRLADLARLRDSGALSAAEFESAKARLLGS